MGDPIMIDAHDIRFSYDGPGGRRSLNGAQLHVSPGEFVAVLGHNGCGKSTLVKHFNALLPLQHGTLTIDGMDAADPANRWALRRKVGMVFQNPDNQFVSTIVGEDVAFGLENYGVPENEIPARVAAAGLTPPMPVQMYYDLKQAGIVLARCPLTLEELAEELCRSQ